MILVQVTGMRCATVCIDVVNDDDDDDDDDDTGAGDRHEGPRSPGPF